MTIHPLRRYRQDNQISLDGMAEMLGVSSATVSRIENYKQSPNWGLVAQLKKISKGKLVADDFLPKASQ